MYLLLKASVVSKGALQSKKKNVGKFPYLGLKFPYFFLTLYSSLIEIKH